MKIQHFVPQLVLLGVLQVAVMTHADASGTGTGAVTSVFPNATGQVFVATASATSQPACAVYGWVIDLNGSAAAGGKAMLATLMWAQALGKQITIVGKGTCDVWGDRETVGGVIVN